jgi:CRP/FNR family cyclic AMP-dependent transcriptional regulator
MNEPRRDPLAVPVVPSNTFWALLPTAERAKLRAAGTVRSYAAGDILCQQGDRLRHVVVLLAGRVEIETQGRLSKPLLMTRRGPGDIIGELAAVDGSPRSATVRAMDDLVALVVPEQRFVLLCRNAPVLTWTVLRAVVRRFRELGVQRTDLVGSTIAARVVSALNDLATQHGADAGRVTLLCTQHELAAMIGGSRESVVRALRRLRVERIISTARGRIVIDEPDRLRALDQ